MNLKLAILEVLARHPGRRIPLDEIRREIETDAKSTNPSERFRRLSAHGDFDIVQSGLVTRNDAGWQITGAGLSMLRSLDDPGPGTSGSSPSTPSTLKLIDDLAGVDNLVEIEDRLQKFDLDIKRLNIIAPVDDASVDQDVAGADQPNAIAEPATNRNTADETVSGVGAKPDDGVGQTVSGIPAFLEKAPRSPSVAAGKKARLLSFLSRAAEAKRRILLQGFQLHLHGKQSDSPIAGAKGSVNGLAFAFFALLGLAACVAAAVALSQIYSFKSENTLLQRELAKVRDHLGKMEQAAVRKEADASRKGPDSQPNEQPRVDRAPLVLSKDEIQSIREFIRPAPTKGSEPDINVGDPVDSPTVLLPSALMEKVPKLSGGRFTIRNGAIIISKRDSKTADLVLPP